MLNENLKFIYESISEWLKFAETKHAAVIVLYGAWIIGFYNIITNVNFVVFLILGYISILCFSIALLISIISFIPVLKSDQEKDKKAAKFDQVNIYFYADIQKITNLEYANVLKSKLNIQIFEPSDLDLINQIWNISKITTRKNNLFKYSVIVAILGLIISIISISGVL